MRALVLLALLAFCSPVQSRAEMTWKPWRWMGIGGGISDDSRFDCIRRHVSEARHLNESRAEEYSIWAANMGMSRVKSLRVSAVLIASEFFSELASGKIDKMARPFQEKGIRVSCDDLAPISSLPPETDPRLRLPTSYKIGPLPSEYFDQRPELGWGESIEAAYREDTSHFDANFPATLDTARRIRDELGKDYPGYFCIGRHIIESIVRIAALAPAYHKQATEAGLPESPVKVSKALLEGHIRLLFKTYTLDRLAAEPQSIGIPIVCNDVPPISDPDYP